MFQLALPEGLRALEQAKLYLANTVYLTVFKVRRMTDMNVVLFDRFVSGLSATYLTSMLWSLGQMQIRFMAHHSPT